jgi:hypothetical protein
VVGADGSDGSATSQAAVAFAFEEAALRDVPAPARAASSTRLDRQRHGVRSGELCLIRTGVIVADVMAHGTTVTGHFPARTSMRHAFIPKGAYCLNLQEGWWRTFRRQALPGQDFADPDEIARVTRVATAELNARARPWIWGRPQPKPRPYHRRFI